MTRSQLISTTILVLLYCAASGCTESAPSALGGSASGTLVPVRVDKGTTQEAKKQPASADAEPQLSTTAVGSASVTAGSDAPASTTSTQDPNAPEPQDAADAMQAGAAGSEETAAGVGGGGRGGSGGKPGRGGSGGTAGTLTTPNDPNAPTAMPGDIPLGDDEEEDDEEEDDD